MTDILNVLVWVQTHPGTVVGIGAVGFALLYLWAALIYALWAAYEEQQADERRARCERSLQAGTPPRDWPTRKGPHGFGRRAS